MQVNGDRRCQEPKMYYQISNITIVLYFRSSEAIQLFCIRKKNKTFTFIFNSHSCLRAIEYGASRCITRFDVIDHFQRCLMSNLLWCFMIWHKYKWESQVCYSGYVATVNDINGKRKLFQKWGKLLCFIKILQRQFFFFCGIMLKNHAQYDQQWSWVYIYIYI